MNGYRLGNALGWVWDQIARHPSGDQDDAELLERFRAHRDEAAFAALLRRHGPMVLGVCQRILRHEHDAEDAFQACFLVLARQAGSVQRGQSLGCWLYKVAHNMALKVKAVKRLPSLESQAADLAASGPEADAGWRELRDLLDAELSRLPERYRAPLVLCYLQGKTNETAARELGWPSGSMAKRLARGRDLLRSRLARRGVTLSAAALPALLAEKAAAMVPARLVEATSQVAAAFAAGRTTAVGAPSDAVSFARGTLQAMRLSKWKTVAAVLLVLTVMAAAGGLLAYSAGIFGGGELARDREEPAGPRAEEADADPLPAGALARLGTARLRHAGPVRAVAFAPDGSLLATAGGDPHQRDWTIRLWAPASGKEVRQLQGHQMNIQAIVFAPDGKTLVSGSDDNTIRLWDVATGKEIAQAAVKRFGVRSVQLSPDAKTVISLDGEDVIRIWDAATLQEIRKFEGARRSGPLAMTADGKLLARALETRGEARKVIELSDPQSGEKRREFVIADLAEHGERHTSHLAFSPDGKLLALVNCDPEFGAATLRVLDTAEGKEVWKIAKSVGAFPARALLSLAFSPDSKWLAIGEAGGAIQLHEAASGKRVRECDCGNALSLAFSPDGKSLVSGNGDGTVRLWATATGSEIRPFSGHQSWVACLALSADGRTLASGSADGTVCLWDWQGRKLLRQFEAHRPGVWSVALSADGLTLATGGSEHRLEEPREKKIGLWDVRTGQRLRNIADGPWFDRVSSVALSPDGKRLAAGSQEGAHVWDVATGKKLHGAGGGLLMHRPVAFAPDGKLLAVSDEIEGSDERLAVTLYSPAGVELRRIKHNFTVTTLAFSPDGKLLAGGGWNQAIVLWDPATGKEIRQLAGDPKGTWRLAFSPDGGLLAAGGEDGIIRVWEPATGKEVGRFTGHQRTVRGLAFSVDGKILLSAGESILIWDLAGLRGTK